MSRLGIYGGSFNPPHQGHTLAAQELIRLLALDTLFVIPAAIPPHKALPAGSPDAQERLHLTELAFAHVEKAQVLDLELRREGPSYTVDTLECLAREHPGDELILIMGTDMLLGFSGWYLPARIAELAKLAVMHRSEDEAIWQKTLEEAARLHTQLGAEIIAVDNQSIEVSSTTVRRLLGLGDAEYLDPAVRERIEALGLYGIREDRRNLPFDRLQEASLSLHDPKRVPHVIGCSQTAEALAKQYGADPELARRAGILHDVTKAIGPHDQLLLARHYGIVPSGQEQINPKLLHAKTGAAVARAVFGECEQVVSAIEWHTTGRANMTVLEKILYLADYMEPNRRFTGVDTLRELVWKDLDAGMELGLRMSLESLAQRGLGVDENSMAAWQFYSNERSKQI